MGGKSGSGGGSSQMGFQASTSTYTPNPEAMAAYRRALGLAENVTSQPYKPYMGQLISGFSPDQMQAFEGVRQTQGMVQPYINAATGLQQQAVNFADPRNYNQQTLQQYYNPYQQDVINATMANLGALQKQQQSQLTSQAIKSGAMGGDRVGIARAALANQLNLSNAQTLAQLQQQGYTNAQQQYNQQQQQAIQTAQNAAYSLGQLGGQAQNAALTGLQALLGTGAQQQQLGQQQLNTAYQQWQQAQAFPYQQAAFYSGIAGGIAPNMGGTTNTVGFGSNQQQQQQAQGGGGGAGSIMSILSMLPAMFGGSDRDDKTDIKYIGKDPETGEKLYEYRYKGDPKTYPKVVGPMAQDIEEHSPERVHEVGGHKIVAGLGHLSPSERDHFEGGGAAAAPSAGSNPAVGGGFGSLAQAAQQPNANLDPGMGQFLQGIYDPQTAYNAAKSKWVNQPQAFDEARFTGDNFQFPPELMQDGGEQYPYYPSPTEPRANGGRINKAEGGGTGSFFDLIKQSGAGGPFANAPGNYIGEAQQIGLGKIIPQAQDKARSITESAAHNILQGLPKLPGPGTGGGGAGGGGGGGSKVPEMKMPKMKGKEASPAKSSGASSSLGDLSSSSEEKAPTAETNPQADASAAATQTPQTPELGGGALEGAGMNQPFDFGAAAAPIEPTPLLGLGIGGFGGFEKGGRVKKAGGGASAGAPGIGNSTPHGGGMAVIGSGGGLGDIVLGDSPTWGDLAGFGQLRAGQEHLTGQNLLDKWNAGVWARDPGPQLTPVEQGMPAMPEADYYTKPRPSLPGELQSEHQGEQNQGISPLLMASAGGMGMKLGLATMLQDQANQRAAADQQSELKAKRAKMLSDPTNFPVQGYYSELGSQELNPRTGLYNIDYTGAYRGYPYKDGGRVAKAPGGGMYGPPMPYDPTKKDITDLAKTLHFEAGNQGDLGMLGVGHVVRNRFESGRYGATPSDVVRDVSKKGVAQFTPWGHVGLGSNRPIEKYQPTEHEMALAQQALTETNDPTKGATHYYNPKLAHPAWGKQMADATDIGAHRFGTVAGGRFHGPQMMARAPLPPTPMAQTQMAAGPATPKPNIPEYTPAEIRPQLAAHQAGATPGGFGDMASATPSEQPVVAADNAPQADFGSMPQNDIQMPDVELTGFKSGGRVALRDGGIADRERQAMQFFISKGYSPAAAAGIVGNLVHESAHTLNPTVPGDWDKRLGRYTSVGIGQWHGSRITDLHNFAARNKMDWRDLNTQLAFVDHELRNSYPKTFERIMNSRTPQQAAGYMVTGYEKPRHTVEGYAPTYLGYRDRVQTANRLMGGDYFAPSERGVPYRPESVPLAFKSAANVSPFSVKEAGFTPAAAPVTYANATPEQRAQMTREAEANAAAQRNALATASRKPGFSLANYIAPPAQAADANVFPEGTRQGPPMRRGEGENRIRGHEHLHTDQELGLTQQPQGYKTFTRQPEWQSSSMGASPNRSMFEDVPEKVSSSDFPMTSQPLGTEGFSEPEVVAKDDRKAAPSQLYWGDYRDVENNPFGDFIDELAGDVRRSRKAGTATTPMGKFGGEGGLGQLFDLEGSLPAGVEAPARKGTQQNQDEGIDLGGLFDIFG